MSKSEAEKYEVCFVSKKKSKDGVSDNLKQAFDAMVLHELGPIWVTEKSCLKIETKESKLFVMDPFEGKVYDHLKSINGRIIGPLSILTCLQRNESLPKRPHPVYSVAMRGVTVTCSNLDKELRDDLCSKIQLMGGNFSKDLTKSVTHLVVGEVGSKKYHVAGNFGLTIMLPEWITELWNVGQHNQVHATDAVFDKFKCPVFKGLCITVSQFGTEERTKLKSMIEANGGRYSGALKSRETTHLVLLEPLGQKYNFAKSWKLHCVRADWLYDSLKSGFCMDEALYPLDETCNMKRSTPIKEKECERLSADCSVINASIKSHLDETIRSEFNVTLRNKLNSSSDEIDAFDVLSLPKSGQFLDGCKIYLCGFKGPHLEKLRKIVNAGGGMRFSKYSDSISHVVCCEKSESLLDLIKSSSVKPHVVTFQWLLECGRVQKLVDEGLYLLPELTAVDFEQITEETVINKDDNTLNKDDVMPSDVKNEGQSDATLFSKDITIGNDFTEILKQYASVNENSPSIACADKDNHQMLSSVCSKNQESITDDAQQPDVMKASVFVPENQSDPSACVNENDSNSLFSGKKFKIIGFGPKEIELLSNMIVVNGGMVFESDCEEKASIGIVPLIWNGNTTNVEIVVTNCWLQKCIEENVLFSFDSNELFSPFNVDTTKQPLQNLVISISQYSGTERDCLMHLAEVLGACCQEYFVRKANKGRGLLPNTHLIVCTPEGSKYEASKKWKIPAVTKHWLLAAVNCDVAPPVENFLVDFQPPELPVDNAQNLKPDLNESDSKGKEKILAEECSVSEAHSVLNTGDKKEGDQEENKMSEHVFVAPNIRVRQLIDGDRRFSPKHGKVNGSCHKSDDSDGNYNPKFDVSGILAGLDSSPDDFYARDKKRYPSLPLQDALTHNFGVALATAGYVHGSESSPESKNTKAEANDANNILKNVTVCVSKKLSGIQSEMNKIVTSLGGQYRWAYDQSCTHYVFQGKANDSSKEFREAKRHGKKIVSPEWIYACRDSNSYVNEECFPHTYKPRQSLVEQIFTTKSSNNDSRFSPIRQNEEVLSSPGVEKDGENLETPKCNENVLDVSNELTSLDELIVAAKSAKAGKRRCRLRTNSNTTSPIDKSKGITGNVISPAYANIYSNTDFKNDLHNMDVVSSSQSVPITWDDPTGRKEREKIAAASQETKVNSLNPESPQSSVPEDTLKANADAHSDENEVKYLSPNANIHKASTLDKKFMFTSFPEKDKAKYCSIINQLGGVVSENKSFDETATHLVLGHPLKNEKFLASVASGKWILHESYLKDSFASNCFLPEEAYEWGSEFTHSFNLNVTGNTLSISMCPRRWRLKLTDEENLLGAFHNWKVVIVSEDQKIHSYARILKAGGAEIFPLSSLESLETPLTHAVVELGKSANKLNYQKHFELLRNLDVKFIKPEYLAYYLIEDPPPSEDDYVPAEVKELFPFTHCVNPTKRPVQMPDPNVVKKSRMN